MNQAIFVYWNIILHFTFFEVDKYQYSRENKLDQLQPNYNGDQFSPSPNMAIATKLGF